MGSLEVCFAAGAAAAGANGGGAVAAVGLAASTNSIIMGWLLRSCVVKDVAQEGRSHPNGHSARDGKALFRTLCENQITDTFHKW